MLQKENFTLDHMDQINHANPSIDKTLLEKMVYAFSLLESLVKAGTPFIFKGGTCLMLLLNHPNRLSTDIDIIVDPDCDIKAYLEKTAQLFPFLRYEEKVRKGANNIEKRHFKFFYAALTSGKEVGILLDVLYEHNHYEKTIQKEIKNQFLLTSGEPTLVTLPTIESILGDKLTAFAPNTTGIPYIAVNAEGLETEKKLEVVKQFFDVSTLFDEVSNFDHIRKTYLEVVQSEIQYRELSVTYHEALLDTFKCALAILSRGRLFKAEYDNLLEGIKKIQNHIFGVRFDGETAYRFAAKVMLLVAGLYSNTDVIGISISDQPLITDAPYNRINRLKALDENVFNQAATAIQMMISAGAGVSLN